MTEMSYRMIALLTDEGAHTVESIAQTLRNGLPDALQLERTSEIIRVVAGEWVYVLGLSEAEHVQDESREIATMFGRTLDEKTQMGRCRRRLEGGGAPDPEGSHAATYHELVEALKKVPHLILFDATKGEILANTVPQGA